jgi:hypothetical protein
MWKWFNCYLSGRHNFGVSCEPGAIFLRCSECGRRSPGWSVDRQPNSPTVTRPADRAASLVASSHKNSLKTHALPITSVAAS